MYENELFLKRDSELRERREKEMKLKQSLENKDYLLSQMRENTRKKKDEKFNMILEEKKLVKENNDDINDRISTFKSTLLGELSQFTKTNPKTIARVGKNNI